MEKQARKDTATGDIVVELSGVSKTFYQSQRSGKLTDVFRNMIRPVVWEVHALQNVDLTIRRGEIVAYAGPNGAGKSTTVKLLIGLLTPTAGKVRVLGMEPVKDRIRCMRRIGVVFGQRTELWLDHPVAASYEWKRVVWDIPKDRFEHTLGVMKELLGIGPFFNSLARELSLGQRMRADLGLALMHEPEMLFLDEPTIGVDVLAKRNILNFIKELNRETNTTVVLTSHDMSDLEQLAERIVMINAGQIAFDGGFEVLRGKFASKRTLMLLTPTDTAPLLHGAQLVGSEAGRHDYVFDTSQTQIQSLLEQASAQTEILDVESHRGSIDDVIADIYESWHPAEHHSASDFQTMS